MLQGVRDVFEVTEVLGQDERGEGKLVLIGRGLAGLAVEDSLRGYLEGGDE